MQLQFPHINVKREAVSLVVLLLAGVVVLPVAIWSIGSTVFGSYAAGGFSDFYGDLLARLASGSPVAWFLVLSPLLGIAVLRLTLLALRISKRQAAP